MSLCKKDRDFVQQCEHISIYIYIYNIKVDLDVRMHRANPYNTPPRLQKDYISDKIEGAEKDMYILFARGIFSTFS